MGLVDTIKHLIRKENLSEEQAYDAITCIMEGQATPAQIASLITALSMKGETAEEIAGAARAMREKSTRINPQLPNLVDTCGTGGDGLHTFNISTTAALVVAASGLPVAKHGNRSVSSVSGSADLLEELGVNLNLEPSQVEQCIREAGIGFLFAPSFHPAMRHAAGPRKELGFRSIFNLLGPLTNPAGAQYQVIGVFRPDLTEVLAGSLARLGTQRALVVHGSDGMDELTLSGPTQVSEVRENRVTTYYVNPQDAGLDSAPLSALQGGTPADNARISLEILNNLDREPRRDAVLFNAGAAIWIGGKSATLKEGVDLAREVLQSGQAYGKLQQLVEVSQALAARQTKAAAVS